MHLARRPPFVWSPSSAVADQVEGSGLVDRFAAGVDLKLAVDLLDVRSHGVRRDHEDRADFGERNALGQKLENLALAEALFLRDYATK